jgi:hypothetical protein
MILLLNQDMWIFPLQKPILHKLQDVPRLARKELSTEARLTEPRSNGSSNNTERLDDAVKVVVIGERGGIRAGVERRRRKRPLRERSGSGGDICP